MIFWVPPSDPRAEQAEKCESPIEQLLCRGLFTIAGFQAVSGDYHPGRRTELAARSIGKTAFVFTQQPIGRYRVDFLVVAIDPLARKSRTLIAEADGERYHNDEEREERRDEGLMRYGIRENNIIHFTGSDIQRYLLVVVTEIAEAVGVLMTPASDLPAYGSILFPMSPQDDRRGRRRALEEADRLAQEEARVEAYRQSLETGIWENDQ